MEHLQRIHGTPWNFHGISKEIRDATTVPKQRHGPKRAGETTATAHACDASTLGEDAGARGRKRTVLSPKSKETMEISRGASCSFLDIYAVLML